MDIDHFALSLPFEIHKIVSTMELSLLACEKADILPDVVSYLRSAVEDAKKLEIEATAYFKKRKEEEHSRFLASSKARLARLSRPPRRPRRR